VYQRFIPSISKFSNLSSVSSSTYLFPKANILESKLYFSHFLAEEWVSYGQVPVETFSERKLATKRTTLHTMTIELTFEILYQPKKAKVCGPFRKCSSSRTHWWRRWRRRRNRARSRGRAMIKYPLVNTNSQVNFFQSWYTTVHLPQPCSIGNWPFCIVFEEHRVCDDEVPRGQQQPWGQIPKVDSQQCILYCQVLCKIWHLV